MKKRYFLYLLVVMALLLSSCAQQAAAPAAEAPAEAEAVEEAAEPEAPAEAEAATGDEPAECAADEFGCAKIESGQTIKIGMGAPMTGDNASFGIDISQGATIAVQDAGEFEGFSFELVAEDDQGTSEGGAAVANKFVTDPTVVAIAGHIFSGATDSAMPIYEKAGLPMMSASATATGLTEQGSAVFNRNAFTDSVQAAAAADYLFNTLGITKIAVMHDGAAYGQGLAQTVSDNFKEMGGEVVAFEAITTGEADYSAPLASLAAMEPEALYFGGYFADAAVLVNQMDQAGLGDTIFFGCDGTYGQDFLEKTGANGEGAYATTLVPASSPEKDKFDTAYQTQFGEKAGDLSPYTWNGYDSAAVLIAAVKNVAIVQDGTMYVPRGALVSEVRNTKDYQGIAGVITCAENGECNATGPVFYIVKDGAWIPVK